MHNNPLSLCFSILYFFYPAASYCSFTYKYKLNHIFKRRIANGTNEYELYLTSGFLNCTYK